MSCGLCRAGVAHGDDTCGDAHRARMEAAQLAAVANITAQQATELITRTEEPELIRCANCGRLLSVRDEIAWTGDALNVPVCGGGCPARVTVDWRDPAPHSAESPGPPCVCGEIENGYATCPQHGRLAGPDVAEWIRTATATPELTLTPEQTALLERLYTDVPLRWVTSPAVSRPITPSPWSCNHGLQYTTPELYGQNACGRCGAPFPMLAQQPDCTCPPLSVRDAMRVWNAADDCPVHWSVPPTYSVAWQRAEVTGGRTCPLCRRALAEREQTIEVLQNGGDAVGLKLCVECAADRPTVLMPLYRPAGDYLTGLVDEDNCPHGLLFGDPCERCAAIADEFAPAPSTPLPVERAHP